DEGPLAQRLMSRFTGAAARAADIDHLRDALRADTGVEPAIISSSYQDAGLLAFYLPDHPHTYSARHQLGGRRSAYDFFPDTHLDDPALLGRPAILVGESLGRWANALPTTVVTEAELDLTYTTPAFGGFDTVVEPTSTTEVAP
ncbi:MAG: hypothetical protein KC983_07975, partial [Phycisphaerales bacterium]|nr:hypothetical protein [Phycisphaerales bacterium]